MMSTLSRSRFLHAALTFGAAALFVACGSGTEPKRRDNVPATITSTTTGALTGVVGTQLNTTLSVVVKNAAGQGADSALVTFAVTSGGGSVSNTTVRTDTTGVAQTTWTLGGTVGAQTVTATVGALTPVTFTATATVSAQTAIAKVAGDNQTAVAGANVAVAPSVKVTDKFGNPVPNVLVTFAASTGGSITGAQPSTDANGVATVGSWRLAGTAGANTLTATAGGITTPVTFAATGTIGPVSRVTITSPQIPQLQIGQTSTITVAVFDANNNPIVNPTVTFSSDNAAIASVNNAGVVTAVSGGTTTIRATSNGASDTRSVTVIGHAGVTVAAKLPVNGRPPRVVAAGTFAYAATGTGGSVTAVNVSTNTVAWTLNLGGTVTDIAVNAANTVVVATSTGAVAPMLYIISPSTQAVIDSVALRATPTRMVMNSAGTRAFVDENTFDLETIDVTARAVVSRTTLPGQIGFMKMAPGDSIYYALTTLGPIYEVTASTGVIRRQLTFPAPVVDFDISPDGKTMVSADNTTAVQLTRLFTGGLTGTLNFTGNISGVAFSPDFQQLWASSVDTEIAAPADPDVGFQTGVIGTKATGTLLTRITFLPNGSAAIVIDEGGINLVIFK